MISTRAFVSYATWGRKQLVFDKSCKSFSCSNCDNRRSRLLHSNSLSHRRQASLHLCATQQPSKLLERVKFDSNGLVPVVAQQYDTQEVLMLAWMDRQALLVTLKEGRACYYSRSRKSLWRKGETSGQVQWLKDIYIDCDGDSVLIKVDQKGVACHTGRRSCFFYKLNEEDWDIVFPVEKSPEVLYGSHSSGWQNENYLLQLEKMGESSNEPFYVQSWHHYLEKNRRLAYFLDSLEGKYAVPTKEEREAFVATVPVYGERLHTLQKVKRTGELSAVAGFALGTYYSVKFSKSPLTSLIVCISSATGLYFLGGTAAEVAFGCYKFDRVETYLQFQKFIRERRSAAN